MFTLFADFFKLLAKSHSNGFPSLRVHNSILGMEQHEIITER